MKGWIGVDLDGTLAHYDRWKGETSIGEPVPAMLERVKAWLAEGIEVKIVTARVAPQDENDIERVSVAFAAILAWCIEHVGQELDVTCFKDFGMIELWDDRAVQVEKNTGRRMDGTEPIVVGAQTPCLACGNPRSLHNGINCPGFLVS